MSIPYQIKVIYDRRKKASATEKGTVEIEIYCESQRMRVSTGVRVLRQQWKLGQVVEHADAATRRRRDVISMNCVAWTRKSRKSK